MKYFLEFLYIRSIIEEAEKESALREYREILFDLAKSQSDSIEQDNPVVTFIQKACGDCGSTFTSVRRTWNGVERIEYVCNGYHRYGKENRMSRSRRHSFMKISTARFANG